MNCLIAVVGPTAAGKSALAIDIAQKFGGEIINADSRQIYRYMDIGTAKPGPAERERIFHHLLDIIDPGEQYSVALYQRSANAVISDIQNRGKLPVMVGGSGQYVWSVMEGWHIPEVKPDTEFREKMEGIAAREGPAALYAKLVSIDPAGAAKILPGNLRRVIRALEIYEQTGLKPSVLQTKNQVPYPVLMIGLTAQREKLYTMINDRTDLMMASGFVEEVQKLLHMGYSADLPSMSSLGYREIASLLKWGNGPRRGCSEDQIRDAPVCPKPVCVVPAARQQNPVVRCQ